jgi:5-methylcytosine-specific restriction protein A
MAWHKTSRHERGYGTEWTRIRKAILERDCHLCQTCRRAGRVTNANIVDHILSKSKGGTDDERNLEAICKLHHDKKTLEEQGKTYKGKVSIGVDGWPTAR